MLGRVLYRQRAARRETGQVELWKRELLAGEAHHRAEVPVPAAEVEVARRVSAAPEVHEERGVAAFGQPVAQQGIAGVGGVGAGKRYPVAENPQRRALT